MPQGPTPLNADSLFGLAWIMAGAVGAALVFVRSAWPAPGHRLRNLAVALVVVACAGLLSLVLPTAWRLGAAWLATALLLQWSHMVVAAGRFVWARAGVAAALVLVAALLLAA